MSNQGKFEVQRRSVLKAAAAQGVLAAAAVTGASAFAQSAGKPQAWVISGRTWPKTSQAERKGANRSAHPLAWASDENTPCRGCHKWVWHPSDDTSLARWPHINHAQYCA